MGTARQHSKSTFHPLRDPQVQYRKHVSSSAWSTVFVSKAFLPSLVFSFSFESPFPPLRGQQFQFPKRFHLSVARSLSFKSVSSCTWSLISGSKARFLHCMRFRVRISLLSLALHYRFDAVKANREKDAGIHSFFSSLLRINDRGGFLPLASRLTEISQ